MTKVLYRSKVDFSKDFQIECGVDIPKILKRNTVKTERECDRYLVDLLFITGWGRAGVPSPGPTLVQGREGIFRVIPAPSTPGVHQHSFPQLGPVC